MAGCGGDDVIDDGLAIYVHWPFCISKCPYCDFNSHVTTSIDHGRWRSAYLRELRHYAAGTATRPVTSIFFGGGTPSLMPAATVAAIIEEVDSHWTIADDCEITLEANPSSTEVTRFKDFRAAGVNRLSVGVQALDDDALRFLGRAHSAEEARAAVAIAARTVENFSFDLICGRPRQTPDAWQRELNEAADLAGGHLSVYQLTIEPGTRFHRDGITPADEDLAAQLYETTQWVLATQGLPSYEISNHARLGRECQHNIHVWQGGDYLGIGPGAHGRISAAGRCEATEAHRSPGTWLTQVFETGHGIAERMPIPAPDRRQELLLMGLRLSRGIERRRFAALTGLTIEDAINVKALAELQALALIEIDAEGMRVTTDGRLRLDALLAAILI